MVSANAADSGSNPGSTGTGSAVAADTERPSTSQTCGGGAKPPARRASTPAADSTSTRSSSTPARRAQAKAPPNARLGSSSTSTQPTDPARSPAPPGHGDGDRPPSPHSSRPSAPGVAAS